MTRRVKVVKSANRYWAVLIGGMVVYVVAMAAAFLSSRPQTYCMAVSMDWNELCDRFFGEDEREVALTLVSSYIEYIGHNQQVNKRKIRFYSFSLVMLMVTVVTLICLVGVDYL